MYKNVFNCQMYSSSMLNRKIVRSFCELDTLGQPMVSSQIQPCSHLAREDGQGGYRLTRRRIRALGENKWTSGKNK